LEAPDTERELGGNRSVTERDLIDRLDRLEADNARLHRELVELRDGRHGSVAAPEGAGDDEPVTRRGMLKLLGGAAAGAGAAVLGSTALAQPAAAAVGDVVQLGYTNSSGDQPTTITSAANYPTLIVENTIGRPGIQVRSPDGVAIDTNSTNGTGLRSHGGVQGVLATSDKTGVYGIGNADNASGVFGQATNKPGGTGVSGSGSKQGVLGTTSLGTGVVGTSGLGTGVDGQTSTYSGVGVRGRNLSTDARAIGVSGSASAGTAIRGDSTSGTGVLGRSSSGIGVRAQGGRAPLVLVPSTSSGPPRSGKHERGELVVDSGGRLYFCRDQGEPGIWVELT
jgi:hypothetical protein